MSTHSLTNKVGIGSRSHDLVGKEFRILSQLPTDTGLKEDRALLFLLSLVKETGTDDCSATLIFIILLLKNIQGVG